ncbi:P-loop NTPase [Microcoleus sp. Pol10D4]|uniref:P-loop NTPase n=1 Tax=Microcoleus sp. Pol10D4 TaxID=3055387 RepID=UPI002FD6E550
MVDSHNLLEQLNKLLDSQQETLFSRLDVDKAHIRMNVTPSQKNIDLIQIFEQPGYGLERIQKALRDLSFFKEFMPPGTYLVGDELLQQEESREQKDMQAAKARGDEPKDYKITPEKFYSFQRGTEWLGVFREWDAPRSFRTELLKTTIKNSQNYRNRPCPATAIIGRGGSGKSVALRRLALDLVDEDYKVWWVENPQKLVDSGLDEFIDHEGQPQFLLIDEIQDMDTSYLKRLREDLRKYPFLVLVVAGRLLPRELKFGAKDKDKNQFIPNEATDRIIILDKIAEVLPAWEKMAYQLKAESLREARLVRILLVLARGQEPVPKTLEELEDVFLHILVDDLERIREQFSGLATAIMDAAIFRQLGMGGLYPSVLIALANDYQPCAKIPMLFQPVTDNPRWDVVNSLLSFDHSQSYFLFHHDELAEGLIQATSSEKKLIEPYIDDSYRRAILDRTIGLAVNSKDNTEIAEVGSELLRLFFLYKFKNALDSKTILQYINQLLDAKVAHYAYLSLVAENILDLTPEQRLEMFLIAAELVPTRQIGNNILWRSVLKWVQDSYPENNIQDQILNQLYQAGCRSYVLMRGWLNNLGPTQAKLRAKEWIKDSQEHRILCRCLKLLGKEAQPEALKLLNEEGQNPQVICHCLALLGQEATEDARKLLNKPGQNPFVICRCLDLLGQEAKEDARKLLNKPGQHPFVICRCLELLGAEAKEKAHELLTTPGQNRDVICRCLELLGQEAKEKAHELLTTPGQDPQVLCRCITVASDTPEAQKVVEEILLRWQAGENLNFAYKNAALRVPFDTKLQKEMALQVLYKWRAEQRLLVASALTVLCNDPDAVIDVCTQILRRWDQEIEYQLLNKRKCPERNDVHIITALAHPNLRKQARAVAIKMVQKEADSPGFLTPLLHEQVLEIAQGKFPSWSGKEEETEPLQTPQMATIRPPKVPGVLSESVSSPKTLSSHPKQTKNYQLPKSPSKSVKKSLSRNLDSWQEKLGKLKDICPDE